MVEHGRRLEHLIRLYALLDELEHRLGGAPTLAECHGRMRWPQRGVYFFREPGEERSGSGQGPRVVRVGTHALKQGSRSTLWGRLAQHRGDLRSGGGNHRGSIFRLLIGRALIHRDGITGPVAETWGHGSTAPRAVREAERPFERRVSAVIRAMPFLWVDVPDPPGPDSQRGVIERGCIALLSGCHAPPIDPPSPGWLGRWSDRAQVRESGLWNVNHTTEDYDPAFLELLAERIASTEPLRP